MPVELITSIATSTIAIAALFTSLWAAITTSKHNRLSVTPNIDIAPDISSKNCGILMDSTGVGPAIIKSFSIVIDGHQINSDLSDGGWSIALEHLKLFELFPDELLPDYCWYPKGHFMQMGSKYWAFKFPKYESASEEEKIKMSEMVERIEIIIEYESIYGDPFKVPSYQ